MTSPSAPPAPLFAADARPAFRRALLAWYRAGRRALPWREDTDPYRVWVSEIMLQQTTVRAVLPYYERFLEAFPTVEALAAAAPDAVLARWSGLGYYSRARNLHRAAGIVVGEHGGAFPQDLEGALALPGVGPYTAAAILSIACGRAHPVVDGNVIRVAARLGRLPGHPKSGALVSAVRRLAKELIDARSPGDFNQAMMELGATVCAPRTPRCPECPVRRWCAAAAAGDADRHPEPSPRHAPVAERRAVVVVQKRDRILLRRRDPAAGVMGGLWELPDLPLDPAAEGVSLSAEHVVTELFGRGGVAEGPVLRLGQVRHAIMNRRIRLEVLRWTPPASWHPGAPWVWVGPAALAGRGHSSIVTKVLRLAGDARTASSTPSRREPDASTAG